MSFNLKDSEEFTFKILDITAQQLQVRLEELERCEQDIYRFISRLGIIKDISNLESHKINLSMFAAKEFCSDIPGCDSCPINKFCVEYKRVSSENYIKDIKNRITFVDLFCGAGGASLGFEQAGFSPVFALDHEKNAIGTYKFNRPYMTDDMIILDKAENVLAEDQIEKNIPNISKKPHMVFGGVPCQGFSNANRQRMIDDPRNKLYKYFVNAVDYLKPEVIVMENVLGIRRIASQIIEDFDSIGYHIDYRVFDSSDFGIPQYRKRVIFIGVPNKTGNNIERSELLSKIFGDINVACDLMPKSKLEDAICGLRPLEAQTKRNDTDYEDAISGYKIDKSFKIINNPYISTINSDVKNKVIYNHKARYNNDRDIEIFTRLPSGENSLHESIEDIMPYKERNDVFKDKYYKLVNDVPCKTITAHMKYDCNMYIHPTQPRGLTVREAARVQSFSDDYIFTGTFQKLYEQVGNAVPPLMGKVIAQAIKENIFRKK
jgi:DNA (cytosine-5)-methyltransferase 1